MGSSEFPGIVVSGPDLHISWEDTRTGPREIYYKHSLDGGQSWGTDTRVSFGQTNAFLACVEAEGAVVHIAWQDERDGNDEIYYKRSTDGGNTWQSELRLTTDNGYSGLPSVAANGSTVHVVWKRTGLAWGISITSVRAMAG